MPQTNTRVFIADDHEVVIKGLCEFINAAPGMEVVGMVRDSEELLKCLETQHNAIDVALVDIGMGKMDGLAATVKIKETYNNIKVVIITGLRGKDYAAESILNNADGFISKSRSHKEIIDAIAQVAAGKPVFMPDLNDPAQTTDDEPEKLPALSPTEKRILCMTVKGMVSKEIALDIKLSQPNVEKHRRTIMHKLGVTSAAAMGAAAIKYGFCKDVK